MYIWVAAGKRDNGAGAAGGPGPLSAGRLCKEHGSVGQALWLVISFPWQKQQKERQNLPVYTRHHWAKADRENYQRIHLLEHHLADVGACFEALLRQPTMRKRLARAGGREELDGTTTARLCVFAALHDIGKVNVGFQARIWRPEDLPPNRKRPPRMGHVADLVPVLEYTDEETANWFLNDFGVPEFMTWDDDDRATASGLLIAALSHHGDPLNLSAGRAPNPAAWRPFGGLNPRQCVKRIVRLVMLPWPPGRHVSAHAAPGADVRGVGKRAESLGGWRHCEATSA